MKKQYERPYAEKVEFDYKDSVAACWSEFGWCGGTKQEESKNNVTNQQSQQNCPQGTSWWVDQNVGKHDNPYHGC